MRRLPLAFGIMLLILAPGCDNDDDPFFPSNQIPGSGNIISEARTLSPFHSVENRIHAEVTLVQGAVQSVQVDADDNLIGDVTTAVVGGVLIIDSNISYSSQNVSLTLVMTEVRDLRLLGVGDISGTSISSAGDVSVQLVGVGNVVLSGTTDRLNATLLGLGNINAEGLQARISTINLIGTGDCRTTVTEELTATLTGSGDIYYAGNPPTVNSTITGTGSLIAI